MIYELMKSRRSIRRFASEAPARELVEKLIEAAITAPSASNKQPWRFIAVTNKGVINRMASEVREALDRIAGHVDSDYRAAVLSYGEYFSQFDNASLVIIPIYRSVSILSRVAGPDLPEPYREDIENMEKSSGLISVSLALQNLLLRAHELGLGAACMTGPLVAGEAIHEMLSIPPSWKVVALVPVGYPDEEPKPTSRKPVANVLRWIE